VAAYAHHRLGWRHQFASEEAKEEPLTTPPDVFQSLWNAYYEHMRPGEVTACGIRKTPEKQDQNRLRCLESGHATQAELSPPPVLWMS